MRPSFRLLKPRQNPFTPTGITGLLTHPHPRPTLIALYNRTLSVLSELPAHSVYRQSAENLTKQRLDIVKSVVPEGYADFQAHLKAKGLETGEQDIRQVGVYMRTVLTDLIEKTTHQGNRTYVEKELTHWNPIPWPEDVVATTTEGVVAPVPATEKKVPLDEYQIVLEPQLSAEQVLEIEDKIGEGLIEEVIEEGWGELKLAETMKEDKPWEPLEVVPEEGQWVAFARTTSEM